MTTYTVAADVNDLEGWDAATLSDALTAPLAKINVEVECAPKQFGGGGLSFDTELTDSERDVLEESVQAIVERVVTRDQSAFASLVRSASKLLVINDGEMMWVADRESAQNWANEHDVELLAKLQPPSTDTEDGGLYRDMCDELENLVDRVGHKHSIDLCDALIDAGSDVWYV